MLPRIKEELDKFIRETFSKKSLYIIIEQEFLFKVVETVRDLKLAGIKIWMLTGDKKETAINLGHSAGRESK